MTTLTLDLEQFTKALADTTSRTLGWVWLQPISYSDDEVILPSYVAPPPSVMPSFVLVNAPSYRFVYTAVRYARCCYLLERDGSYEAGELTVIHDLIVQTSPPSSEGSPPPEPLPFVPPTITTYQTTSIGSIGSLGVTFSFIHDVTTNGSDSKFGLAFKITNALPAVYPRLNLSYITAIAPEDV